MGWVCVVPIMTSRTAHGKAVRYVFSVDGEGRSTVRETGLGILTSGCKMCFPCGKGQDNTPDLLTKTIRAKIG